MTSNTSVDQNEVDHFNSTNWWHGINLLHTLNNVREPFVRDTLIKSGKIKEENIGTTTPLKDLLILDAGCGGGIFTERLAKLGCTIVGIDPGEEVIRIAKEHAHKSLTNLTYSVELVEDHAKNNYQKYDVIIASEVVEHVSNPRIYLEACIKCLKPGGSIIVTTINKTWLAWFIHIILLEKVMRIVPSGTHQYDKFISPEAVENILKQYDCAVKEVQGVMCNALTRSFNWSESTLVNYFLHAIKNNEIANK